MAVAWVLYEKQTSGKEVRRDQRLAIGVKANAYGLIGSCMCVCVCVCESVDACVYVLNAHWHAF